MQGVNFNGLCGCADLLQEWRSASLTGGIDPLSQRSYFEHGVKARNHAVWVMGNLTYGSIRIWAILP